jgi:hypothetical protein
LHDSHSRGLPMSTTMASASSMEAAATVEPTIAPETT